MYKIYIQYKSAYIILCKYATIYIKLVKIVYLCNSGPTLQRVSISTTLILDKKIQPRSHICEILIACQRKNSSQKIVQKRVHNEGIRTFDCFELRRRIDNGVQKRRYSTRAEDSSKHYHRLTCNSANALNPDQLKPFN